MPKEYKDGNGKTEEDLRKDGQGVNENQGANEDRSNVPDKQSIGATPKKESRERLISKYYKPCR